MFVRFCPSFADDIDNITLVDGANINDYTILYDVDAASLTGQLVVHFKQNIRSGRSKRERSNDSDSDDDIEIIESKSTSIPTLQCSRCGENIESNEKGCFHHSGAYVTILSEEVPLNVVNDASEIAGDTPIETTTERRETKRWTCCNNYDRFSRGCTETSHLPTRSVKTSLDQKLLSMFTSNASWEPPSVDPKNLAAAPRNDRGNDGAPRAPIDVDDDDDVQIIPRAQIVGNANPNAAVNLHPIIAPSKTFALNEHRTHNWSSALGLANGTHLESDCDAELILAVGWTTIVKPSNIAIHAHQDVEQAPSHIKIFINKSDTINFDNCNDIKPDFEAKLTAASYVNGIASIQLPARLFTKVANLTLYVTGNIGNHDVTTIRRLVFTGAAPNLR